MERIAEQGNNNIVFLPRSRSRYFEYAPLAHLLPKKILERFGLPLLAPGQWPLVAPAEAVDRYLPEDFAHRLSRAWAATSWTHLGGRSAMNAFTRDDPIRLLAHNLEYWLPSVTEAIQDILRELPEVDRGVTPAQVTLTDGSPLPGAVWANTRMGSDVWHGEAEADAVVAHVVHAADATGKLRALLDAVPPAAVRTRSLTSGQVIPVPGREARENRAVETAGRRSQA